MLKIDGAAIPSPSEFRITIKETAVSQRNAAGDTIIDFSGGKRVLKLKWARMCGERLAALLQNVEGRFFEATFPDPASGGMQTARFWCSGRGVGMLRMQGDIPVWTDIEMEWSER